MKPDDLLSNPVATGFLGSLLGQRALNGASLAVRAGYLLSSWAAAILFGPWLAGWLGASSDPRAFAAVVGMTAAFGVVLFDGALRYIQETPTAMLIDRIITALQALKGGGK
jgi:hypothetical protein